MNAVDTKIQCQLMLLDAKPIAIDIEFNFSIKIVSSLSEKNQGLRIEVYSNLVPKKRA
jgi:hypothetical protein